ncbi:MAG: SWIM zinc finger family protein [Oxalobacteraceae bacterium]|nr:MAG: SWIM zinc finger family protein [Oxalobacteraceae bacterium]
MILDANQILALAPDAASAKAGSQLALPRNWSNLGRSESAVWGECQGSGKQPYWLQSRKQRQEKKAAKPEPPPEAAATAAAQARKREGKREDKVDAGLRELQTWLHDLAREGLASVRSRGQGFWEAIAARMVDAQAAPLARRLRRAGGMLYQSNLPHAEQLVAHELASLYLLGEAWRRLGELPAPLQADVRSLLGWPVSQEDVLRETPLQDHWHVLSQTVSEDERLRVRASWLRGATSGHWALVLQYAAGTQGFEQGLVPGTAFDGALHFYPGAFPLRALVGQQAEVRALADGPGPASGVDALLDDYAHALAAQPFLERFPALLADLVPDADHRILRDAQGRGIELHPSFRHAIYLLAVSGGQPLTVFGEWDGRTLLPLSVWHEGRLHNIDSDFIS